MKEYNKSDKFYEKSAEVRVCGCIGLGYGEPLCACSMAREGLPMSVDHVAALDQSEKEWAAFFASGGFNFGR